jgi:tyrosinase
MLDRVWWLWQALHREQAATIAGTITLSNRPPSRNATLDDVVQMNYLGLEARKIGDLLSVVDGPFCYIYL